MKKGAIIGLSVGGILLLIIAGIVVVAIFIFKGASGMNDVAQNHLDLIKNGDINAAYDMTSDEFKSATSLEEYKDFIKETDIMQSYEKAELNSVSEENGVRTITGSLKNAETTMPIQFVLTKVGEGDAAVWKIISIEMNPSGFVAEDATADDSTNSLEE